MKTTRRSPWLVLVVAALSLLIASSLMQSDAVAGPRSGGSFGGRLGFRSGGGSSMPRSYSGGGYGNGYGGGSYGGGSHFFFLPGWGWGGGYGFGGGMGMFGTLMFVAVVGVTVFSVSRALRRYRQSGGPSWAGGYGDEEADAVAAGRAYVYRLQVGLGRSARGIQDRLEAFASSGDTSTEAGLASLLQQTALELLREKDSVRYAGADAAGPMNLTNAETRLGSLTLAERSRFQVERVRAADGQIRRAQTVAEEGKEALEYVMVTIIVATRTPFAGWKDVQTPEDLGAVLTELGAVSPGGLLGLEVVWTPADANDSMTETDVMTTYPDLRSL